ncbi:MAG: hypothetical protein NZ781_13035, partial [Armatimonadetes bacterium]|nr:hypothetical protein [Armatimonadota bacterium]
CDLKWAKGRFPTPHWEGEAPAEPKRGEGEAPAEPKRREGEAPAEPQEIEIRWERDERNFTLWFALPSSVKAEIVLPKIVPESASINVKLVKGEAAQPRFEANHWRINVSVGSQGKVEAIW